MRARIASLLRRDRISRDAGPSTPERDGASESLTAGDLVLSAASHEVTLRGVPIKLRPREFALLEFFMRNPSQVFSRDVILEKVWGLSYPGETRTVDVHVRWLREKIEDDPSDPRHIQTVRSVGYKFQP